MTDTIRRSLLKGIMASAALAPSMSVVAAAPAAKDAKLLRLGSEFAQHEASYLSADGRFESAAREARANWPVVPEDMRVIRSWPRGNLSECPVTGGYGYENGERQNYSVIDHGDYQWSLDIALARRPRTERAIEAKTQEVSYWTERLQRLDRFEAECDAVRRRFDIPALVRARDAAKHELGETVRLIYGTPAETIEGLAVKARVIESEAARIADIITAQFKLPGSIANDIAWMAAGARGGL